MYRNYAKDSLAKSMYALLENNTLESITIADITELSGLSRSTFYRHFLDKYDLMHYCHHAISYPYMKEYDGTNLKEILTKIYSAMAQRKSFYRNALLTDGANCFSRFWDDYSGSTIRMFLSTDFDKETLTPKETAMVNYAAGGVIQVLKFWVE